MKKLTAFVLGGLSILVAIPVLNLIVENLELISEKCKAKNTIEISKANIEIAKLQESIQKSDSFAVGYDMGNTSEFEDDDYDNEDNKVTNKNRIGFNS